MLAGTQHPHRLSARPRRSSRPGRIGAAPPERALRRHAHARLCALVRPRPRRMASPWSWTARAWTSSGPVTTIMLPPRTAAAASPIQGTKQRTTRAGMPAADFRALANAFQFRRTVSRTRCATASTRTRATPRFPRRCASTTASPCARRSSYGSPSWTIACLSWPSGSPRERKIENGTRKKLLRDVARHLIPHDRRGPQAPRADTAARMAARRAQAWARDCIESALQSHGNTWLDADQVRKQWQEYCLGQGTTASMSGSGSALV